MNTMNLMINDIAQQQNLGNASMGIFQVVMDSVDMAVFNITHIPVRHVLTRYPVAFKFAEHQG